jgi:hypothetical protein
MIRLQGVGVSAGDERVLLLLLLLLLLLAQEQPAKC